MSAIRQQKEEELAEVQEELIEIRAAIKIALGVKGDVESFKMSTGADGAHETKRRSLSELRAMQKDLREREEELILDLNGGRVLHARVRRW